MMMQQQQQQWQRGMAAWLGTDEVLSLVFTETDRRQSAALMQLLCGTMVQMAQDVKPAAAAERASETELRLAYLSLLFLHLGTRLGLPRFELQLCAGKTFTAAVAAFYAECNVDLARGLGLAAAKRLAQLAHNAPLPCLPLLDKWQATLIKLAELRPEPVLLPANMPRRVFSQVTTLELSSAAELDKQILADLGYVVCVGGRMLMTQEQYLLALRLRRTWTQQRSRSPDRQAEPSLFPPAKQAVMLKLIYEQLGAEQPLPDAKTANAPNATHTANPALAALTANAAEQHWHSTWQTMTTADGVLANTAALQQFLTWWQTQAAVGGWQLISAPTAGALHALLFVLHILTLLRAAAGTDEPLHVLVITHTEGEAVQLGDFLREIIRRLTASLTQPPHAEQRLWENLRSGLARVLIHAPMTGAQITAALNELQPLQSGTPAAAAALALAFSKTPMIILNGAAALPVQTFLSLSEQRAQAGQVPAHWICLQGVPAEALWQSQQYAAGAFFALLETALANAETVVKNNGNQPTKVLSPKHLSTACYLPQIMPAPGEQLSLSAWRHLLLQLLRARVRLMPGDSSMAAQYKAQALVFYRRLQQTPHTQSAAVRVLTANTARTATAALGAQVLQAWLTLYQRYAAAANLESLPQLRRWLAAFSGHAVLLTRSSGGVLGSHYWARELERKLLADLPELLTQRCRYRAQLSWYPFKPVCSSLRMNAVFAAKGVWQQAPLTNGAWGIILPTVPQNKSPKPLHARGGGLPAGYTLYWEDVSSTVCWQTVQELPVLEPIARAGYAAALHARPRTAGWELVAAQLLPAAQTNAPSQYDCTPYTLLQLFARTRKQLLLALSEDVFMDMMLAPLPPYAAHTAAYTELARFENNQDPR